MRRSLLCGMLALGGCLLLCGCTFRADLPLAQETAVPESSSAISQAGENPDNAEGEPQEMSELLAGMTLREKVGQLFFARPDSLDPGQTQVQINDANADGVTCLTQEMAAVLERYPVGGVVLFGKNAMAVKELNSAIRERTSVSKFYLTVTAGEMKRPLLLKDRMTKDREKNMVSIVPDERGKTMETSARPLLYGNGFSLVEVEIITGRTHQIRVQLAAAGYPLIGDPKYGNRAVNRKAKEEYGLKAQLLHAYRLRFGDLDGGLGYLSDFEIKAGVPEEFRETVRGIFGRDIEEI